MPFSFSSSLNDAAKQLGSIVTNTGSEYMSSFDKTSFQVPALDVSKLGGIAQVGSLAGNSTWFNTFNASSILNSTTGVPNASSITSSLPSLSSIKDTASSVASGATGFLQSAQATAASAIQNAAGAVTAGATGFAQTAQSTVANATNLFAANPAAASGVAAATRPLNTAPVQTDAYGLTILNDAQTAEVTRNVNPAFVNSLVDPNTPKEIINTTTGEITYATEPVNLSNQASQYTSAYDPETGKWSVYDNATSTTVQSGLSEQQAILAEQDLNINSGISLSTSTTASEDPFEASRVAAEQNYNNTFGQTEAAVVTANNATTAALTEQARAQQTVRELRNNKAQSSDWRVRLKLAPNSTYLYNETSPNGPGILAPLKGTDGVIFPYTPTIDTAYKANYSPYDMTHSNYRGYFYQSSYVDAINVRANFTAQDTKEADYLLAVIHFFRSATKMFYGQDTQRGSPPPLVYLNGYGDYQFAEHPCVISQFNYSLPADVDYIRAQSSLTNNTNQLNARLRNPIANNPLAYSANRLLNSKLLPGALDFRPTTPGSGNLASGNPTYVPTKMEISITLLPVQSRSQISNNFSVKSFANGNLLKNGYW